MASSSIPSLGGGGTVTNVPNSPGSNLAPVNISNLVSGGVIGTAAVTVDINSAFNVSQSTIGQTLSLPTPTTATTARMVSITNTGTASFIMHGYTINTGVTQSFVYNGINWFPDGQGVNVISEIGIVQINNQSFTTNTFVDSTNGIFAIPSAGTWKLRYDISTDGTSVATIANSMLAITDSSNTIITGSEKARPGTNTAMATLTAEVIVTTSNAATYKLRGRSGSAAADTMTILNGASHDSTLSWEKIGGFIPVIGTSVDYVQARRLTTSQFFNSSDTGAQRNVIMNSLVAGNIPYNITTGILSLTAGKTYKLEANLKTRVSGGSRYVAFIWVDSAGVQIPGSIEFQAFCGLSTLDESSNTGNSFIYTPSTNQDISLRISDFGGSTGANAVTIDNFRSNITVMQLGSSAVYAGVYPGTWTSYTPIITSTGTAPTLATTHTKNAIYKVEGKTLCINWNYYAASAAGASIGSGVYKFSIPSGYVIDITKAILPSIIGLADWDGADALPLGNGCVRQTGAWSPVVVVALSATEVGLYTFELANLIGAGQYSWNTANASYSFTATIPIL